MLQGLALAIRKDAELQKIMRADSELQEYGRKDPMAAKVLKLCFKKPGISTRIGLSCGSAIRTVINKKREEVRMEKKKAQVQSVSQALEVILVAISKEDEVPEEDEKPKPPPKKLRDDVDGLVNSYRQEGVDNSSDEEGPSGYDVEARPKKPFVDWIQFNLGIGFLIVSNAVVLGIETDMRSGGSKPSQIFFVIEIFFTLAFLAELIARLWFYRLRFFCHPKDMGWNILDTIIVTVSIADTFVLNIIGMGGSARFVTMLRFLRLLRLIRLVRLFRIFKELWLVASGLINSMRTLLWVCVIIFIFLEICAVPTTRWIGQNNKLYDPYFVESKGWDHEIYFATIVRSMFTLFQVLTLDNWSEHIARHVVKNQPAMAIFFLIFICITSFGLLNIIVGVVVETTLTTASQDQVKQRKMRDRDRQMVFSQLREIFSAADTDGSGTLTIEEVEDAVNKPEIYNKLKMIDFPVDDPEQIFVLLDYDDSGELTIEEFITGCMRMKGTAKSKDLLVAQVAVDCMRRYFEEFDGEMAKFRHKLAKLDMTARAIVGHGEQVFLDMRQYRHRHPSEKGAEMPSMPMDAPWNSNAYDQYLEDGEESEMFDINDAKTDVSDAYTPVHALEDTKNGLLQLPSPPGPPRLALQNNRNNDQIALENGQMALQNNGQAALQNGQGALQDREQEMALALPGSLRQS